MKQIDKQTRTFFLTFLIPEFSLHFFFFFFSFWGFFSFCFSCVLVGSRYVCSITRLTEERGSFYYIPGSNCLVCVIMSVHTHIVVLFPVNTEQQLPASQKKVQACLSNSIVAQIR